MEARVLPVNEWNRLNVTELPVLLPYFRPEDVNVVVVEEAGAIVASLAVMRVPHLEGVWIEPSRRGSPELVRKLMSGAAYASRKWSSGWVMAQSATDHVSDLITRLGASKVPVETFIVPLGD